MRAEDCCIEYIKHRNPGLLYLIMSHGFSVDKWARPVFGLTDDFKGLSRDEREERDWAHLSQAARRRLR